MTVIVSIDTQGYLQEVRKVLAVDTPTLLRLTNIAPTTLNYWVSRGFCAPSIDTGTGRRATRFWTVHDVLVIRAVKRLRDLGCSLQNLSKVQRLLASLTQKTLGTSVLIYDGHDLFLVDEGHAVSLLRTRGQALFLETLITVSIPMGPWLREAKRAAEPIDPILIRNRREQIAAKRRAS